MNEVHLLLVIFLTHFLMNYVQLKIHRLMANTASMAVLSFANLAVPFSLIGVGVHVSNSIGGTIVSPFGSSAITEPSPFTAVLLFPPNAGFWKEADPLALGSNQRLTLPGRTCMRWIVP